MVLAGDIGGTNTRLAFFDVKGGRLKPPVLVEETFPSREYASLDEIVRQIDGNFLRAFDDWTKVQYTVFRPFVIQGDSPIVDRRSCANLYATVGKDRLKAVKIAGRVLAGILVAGISIWAAGALYYSPIPNPTHRTLLAVVFVAAVALAFLFLPRRRTLIGFFVVFAVLVALFLNIPASNDRDWQPEVAMTPYATINGDRVTIHGVRNLDYRTETDFTPRWETRTYDLSKLDSVYLIAVYWGSKAIAHTMMSFGFEGKDYVTMSIETRKEIGESYSTIAGFFRQYELVYIVADERDIIGVRTTYRQPQEDVYVYRVRTPRENIRRGFLDYVKTMNEMRERARFYNTLTTNCTTGIWLHTRINPESPPLSWKILLSGYVPDYLYALGRLDTTRPFAELEKISHVNARAHAADRDPAFSQRIREGLPQPPLP